MAKFEDMYNFNWLPGFKEMMACQEEQEEHMQEREGEMTENDSMMPEMNRDEEMNQNMGIPSEMNRDAGMEMPSEMNRDAGMEMLPPEQLQKDEQEYWKDYEYVLRMLPVTAREIWAAADAILDRYEFEGSSIYAEYPDKNAILKIVDLIYDKLKYYENNLIENKLDGTEGKNKYYMPEDSRGVNTPLRDMILVMTAWNMAYRRQRYFRRKKVFPG